MAPVVLNSGDRTRKERKRQQEQGYLEEGMLEFYVYFSDKRQLNDRSG